MFLVYEFAFTKGGGWVIVLDFSAFPGLFDFPFCLFEGEAPDSYFSNFQWVAWFEVSITGGAFGCFDTGLSIYWASNLIPPLGYLPCFCLV